LTFAITFLKRATQRPIPLRSGLFFSKFFQGMSDEAHFSAQQSCPRPASRIPSADVDSGRSCSDSRASQSRPQKAVGLTSISARKDFLAANSAKRAPMPGFVLLVRNREDGDPAKRLGITVTKKIGNAVIRNRMKRRFRALARDVILTEGQPGADHVLIGRAGGVERDYSLLRTELAKALQKVAR
jgi:ribonuclease P protein component